MDTRKELLRQLYTNTVHLWRCLKADRPTASNLPTLTATQREILFMLKQREEVAVKDVAEQLEITGSAATQLIDTLVLKGIVVRSADPDDRRVVRIRLSKLAATFVDQMKRKHEAWVETLLSDLSDDELTSFVSLISKIGSRVECDRTSTNLLS